MSQKTAVIRIVLAALLCYSLIMYASSKAQLRQMEGELAAAEESLEMLRAENERMEQRLSDDYRGEEMLRLARERLGLVLPGEKVFYFSDRGD